MKLNKKHLLLMLIVILALVFAVACDKDITDEEVELTLPEFSIEFNDGEEVYTLTNAMLADIDLADFSYESKGVTSYYKGIKVSDILAVMTSIENQEGILSLLVISEDGYGEDQPALPLANFANAYLTFFYSETQDGEFHLLSADNGPVRLYDTTTGTEVKSIKQVATINVIRPNDYPVFSINFNDGEETIVVTNETLSALELHSFSVESRGVTTYFKGLKVSEILPVISGLPNQSEIVSLLVVASDGYGEDQPVLPAANFENAYFALYFSETEDGEYEPLSSSNGPVRLYDTTPDTSVKSIKQVARVDVNR